MIICDNCNQEMDHKFSLCTECEDKAQYHAQCLVSFNDDFFCTKHVPKCNQCSLPLDNKILECEWCSTLYHKKCLITQVYEGMPICVVCAEKCESCGVQFKPGDKITSCDESHNSNNNIHKKCSHEDKESGPLCTNHYNVRQQRLVTHSTLADYAVKFFTQVGFTPKIKSIHVESFKLKLEEFDISIQGSGLANQSTEFTKIRYSLTGYPFGTHMNREFIVDLLNHDSALKNMIEALQRSARSYKAGVTLRTRYYRLAPNTTKKLRRSVSKLQRILKRAHSVLNPVRV